MIADVKKIYHYCSIDAFIKILTSSTIWLSHVQTTNDSQEDRVYSKTIKKIAKEVAENEPEFKKLFSNIAENYIKKNDFPYTCSFSKDKDKLSQWRAYGDDGTGVAIGFDLSKFSFFDIFRNTYGDQDPNICIEEVSYNNKQDGDLIKSTLQSGIVLNRKYGWSLEKIENTLSYIFDLCSVFSKNDSFSEEQEVRMVYFPCYMELLSNLIDEKFESIRNLPIQFRAKGSEIISYFAYPLPKDSIFEIVLGPKCKTDYNQLALFLSQFAPTVMKGSGIFYSKSSYR